jgi:hypothetical protein
MKLKKHITYLLLICFAAFLGHNLVPHHHHSEVYQSPIATDCPFEHGDHHGHKQESNTNSGEHPVHCHAFNDVVFQKYNAPTLRPWAGFIQAIIIPGQIEIPEDVQSCSSHTFLVLKLPCKTAEQLGLRDLRAPPVFV